MNTQFSQQQPQQQPMFQSGPIGTYPMGIPIAGQHGINIHSSYGHPNLTQMMPNVMQPMGLQQAQLQQQPTRYQPAPPVTNRKVGKNIQTLQISDAMANKIRMPQVPDQIPQPPPYQKNQIGNGNPHLKQEPNQMLQQQPQQYQTQKMFARGGNGMIDGESMKQQQAEMMKAAADEVMDDKALIDSIDRELLALCKLQEKCTYKRVTAQDCEEFNKRLARIRELAQIKNGEAKNKILINLI